MKKLAIHGGPALRTTTLPGYNSIGEEEKAAVTRVLESGILSAYQGCWGDEFEGGPEVRALEAEWASFFKVKHAIAVNSATSGIQAALGASSIGPGDEVIVSPFTMCASATAPLLYGAVPIFADIEPDYLCLDPKSVEKKITPRTKAIVVVDITGQPYDADPLNALARKHNLLVIEDNAQAPGALYKGRFAGTLGDIGIFSLNRHKHIHCGEGGIVTTNDDNLALRVKLIRNHAEAVVKDAGVTDLTNMVGFNFRLTEPLAAIARCQLKKLPHLLSERQKNCAFLNAELKKIPCLTPLVARPESTHSYYIHPILFNAEIAGVNRDQFIEAVAHELDPHPINESERANMWCGYTAPLYRLPIFQKKISLGGHGFPWNSEQTLYRDSYNDGTCPVAERLHAKEIFVHENMRPGMTQQDLKDVVAAFYKVWENRHELTQ